MADEDTLMADEDTLEEVSADEELTDTDAEAEAGDADTVESPELPAQTEDLSEEVPRLNDIEELPVDLTFVSDQIKMPLKEVEQIKPGYVIALNKVAGQVEIRANGAVVGSGELVQIEDKAGVRILELYQQNDMGQS